MMNKICESTEARIAHRLQVHPHRNGIKDLISIDHIATGRRVQQQRGESPSAGGERTRIANQPNRKWHRAAFSKALSPVISHATTVARIYVHAVVIRNNYDWQSFLLMTRDPFSHKPLFPQGILFVNS